LNTFLRICIGLSITLATTFVFSETKVVQSFSKISYQDQTLANKILISFHHAILEVNREEKYLIATLTAEDKKLLSSHPVIIGEAELWSTKFQQKLGQIKANQNSDKSQLGAAVSQTIPGYECFSTVEETYQQAQTLADDFPKLAKWIDIGDSWHKVNQTGGYDLMVLKITNQDIVREKPILFIHSSMHAREYAPAALNLDFAKWLINNYATDAEAQWLVEHREIHLLFHMNPDGRKIAETQVLQRKNTNKNHCADSAVGVDLNRNFAQKWNATADGSSGNECSEVYRGISAESEPETKAVSDYVRSLFPDERGLDDDDAAPVDKSGLHLDIHSYGRLILWPYGHKAGSSPNNDGFVNLGNKLAWFNGYAPQQSIGLYATDGTSDNVSYGELGVAAITFELGSSFFQDCASYESTIKPDNLAALIYAAKVSAAPYQLPSGPDISLVTVNNSLKQTSVTAGSDVDLAISATVDQTLLSGTDDVVSRIEYSIDQPFGSESSEVISLEQSIIVDSDGNATASAQIDTSTMSLGPHIIYVQALNTDNQVGVSQAVFINIAESNAPIPSFTTTCQDLSCSFDASASTDSDGEIVSYRWILSDGTLADGVSISHTFANAGEKNVSMEVEDDHGLKSTTIQSFSVTAIEVITVVAPKDTSSGGSLNWFYLLLLTITIIRRK